MADYISGTLSTYTDSILAKVLFLKEELQKTVVVLFGSSTFCQYNKGSSFVQINENILDEATNEMY